MCIFENAFIPLKGKFSQDSYKSTFSFFFFIAVFRIKRYYQISELTDFQNSAINFGEFAVARISVSFL